MIPRNENKILVGAPITGTNSRMVGHSEVIPKNPLVEIGPPLSRITGQSAE
jgi:hypothetical protein